METWTLRPGERGESSGGECGGRVGTRCGERKSEVEEKNPACEAADIARVLVDGP